jgi:hypothetical protein
LSFAKENNGYAQVRDEILVIKNIRKSGRQYPIHLTADGLEDLSKRLMELDFKSRNFR